MACCILGALIISCSLTAKRWLGGLLGRPLGLEHHGVLSKGALSVEPGPAHGQAAPCATSCAKRSGHGVTDAGSVLLGLVSALFLLVGGVLLLDHLIAEVQWLALYLNLIDQPWVQGPVCFGRVW